MTDPTLESLRKRIDEAEAREKFVRESAGYALVPTDDTIRTRMFRRIVAAVLDKATAWTAVSGDDMFDEGYACAIREVCDAILDAAKGESDGK